MSDPQAAMGVVGVLNHMLPAAASQASGIFNPGTGEVTPLSLPQTAQPLAPAKASGVDYYHDSPVKGLQPGMFSLNLLKLNLRLRLARQ
jgi:hypothetical protein